MAIIEELTKNGKGKDYYFGIDECVKYGSDPKKNRGKNGNLNVPIYAITYASKDGKFVYIQYLFFYGFNMPFDLAYRGTTLYKGDKIELQDAHEGDLEHITVQLDNKKPDKPIISIFYGAHGGDEGTYVYSASTGARYGHKEHFGTVRERERNGKLRPTARPIVFSARGSHATYYKQGTWLRMYGVANDHTEKARGANGKDIPMYRWDPKVVRIYANDDARYDANTMAWLYWSGFTGKHGVSSASKKAWWLSDRELREANAKKRQSFYVDKYFCPPKNTNCERQHELDADQPPDVKGASPYVHNLKHFYEYLDAVNDAIGTGLGAVVNAVH